MDVLTRESLGMSQADVEAVLSGTEVNDATVPQPVQPISLLPGWETAGKKVSRFPKWLIPVGIVVGGLILLRR